MRLLRRTAKYLLLAAVGLFLLSVLLVSLYRYLPPPVTPLMVVRLLEGEGLDRRWLPYERISPHLVRAVISAEDARFCLHRGIDWQAVRQAWQRNQRGERLYGGSTITMQTAKNLFLWEARSWVRKAVEAYFTLLLERLLDKQRILELYLNVVEWGPGVYGAEAAARHHFGKSAADLTRREAALLAAVLPSPRRWSPSRPSGFVARKAGTILERMRIMPDRLDPLCSR